MRKIFILIPVVIAIFGLSVSVFAQAPQNPFGETSGSVNNPSTSGSVNNPSTSGSVNNPSTSGSVNNPGIFENPLKFNNFMGFFQAVVRGVIVPVGAVIAVLALIYSGFLFVVAQGNEEKLRKARVTFLYTVIGTILLLGAWAVVEVITSTLCQITNVPGLCAGS